MFKVEVKKYKSGDIICQQSDKTDKLFVLKSGKIKVIVNHEKKITPELVKSTGHQINEISTPNQTIGEIGLLLNRDRTASLVADNSVELEVISFEGDIVLSDVIKHNKQIGLNIVHTVVNRINHTAEQIYDAKKNVDKLIGIINEFTPPLAEAKLEGQANMGHYQAYKQLLKSKFDMISDYIKAVNREYSGFEMFETRENNVLKKGQLFFLKNSDEECFFLMIKGKVNVLCNKLPVITCEKDNTIFANYSVLFNNEDELKNFFEFVAADDNVKIKKIEKEQFFGLLDKEPALYGYLSKILCTLLVNTDKVLLEIKKRNETLISVLSGDPNNLKTLYEKILELKIEGGDIQARAVEFFEKLKELEN